jgi:hypothetical protein
MEKQEPTEKIIGCAMKLNTAVGIQEKNGSPRLTQIPLKTAVSPDGCRANASNLILAQNTMKWKSLDWPPHGTPG